MLKPFKKMEKVVNRIWKKITVLSLWCLCIAFQRYLLKSACHLASPGLAHSSCAHVLNTNTPLVSKLPVWTTSFVANWANKVRTVSSSLLVSMVLVSMSWTGSWFLHTALLINHYLSLFDPQKTSTITMAWNLWTKWLTTKTTLYYS